MTENKERTFEYLVEIIYQQTYIRNPDTPEARKEVEVASQIFSFTNPDKSIAKFNAEKEMDKYIRHGLVLRGGSVIKSIIHPSAILQVGLIDMELHQKEQEELAAEQVRGAISPSVPPLVSAEVAEISSEEAV